MPVPIAQPVADSRVDATQLLELLKWHIDRYDRLRSSTSTRASILLSANTVLLTGMILLANYRLQQQATHPIGGLDLAVAATLVVAVVLNAASITSCVNAIAARKTTRSLHREEIPDRFLFNWGDTIRTVDGFTSFSTKVASLETNAILGHATAELWTDILQHRRRHRHLRQGVSLFRFDVPAFLIFATLTLLAIL
ncbi:hypothetical protein [Kutzneria kofuensis]|uniref:Pycsar effector protein domain-containing protein n=1 Tax=Kutzneria kofuensis TaxID=103725 RepID=A0A7W9KIM2_9PSEU|nr:hypothetical protein [Kutzneria kofuensis]MBB5892968.1 hypothetical protein [Kutzneria kofuensis]